MLTFRVALELFFPQQVALGDEADYRALGGEDRQRADPLPDQDVGQVLTGVAGVTVTGSAVMTSRTW
jgi:hypothetical protein